MKLPQGKLSGILIGSALAVLGLVVFQLTWMRHSKRLTEEIFNQRVSMALCSAVENYKGGILCEGNGCAIGGLNGATGAAAGPSFHELRNDSLFNADLRRALDFYQIHLNYQLDTLKAQPSDEPCCAISLPASQGPNIQLSMVFPDKESFVLGNMNFMVLATVLILLFTIIMLLTANWSLLKQKKLLQTNVDYFNHMAHEFRTPLTNMGLAVNMLARKHQELQNNPLLDILKKENGRLMEEVDRVLQLSTLEKGDFALEKAPVSVGQLLKNVLDNMSMVVAERKATIQIEKIPENWIVNGDAKHLEKAFRNLLDNALKYNNLQPEINITAKAYQQGILIGFEDNGVGIPPGQCEIIFNKFQRATNRQSHGQQGFGLGLAYVKSIIELHRGFVRASSEANQGSRFEVYLPATKQ